jgi:hypothetical protein
MKTRRSGLLFQAFLLLLLSAAPRTALADRVTWWEYAEGKEQAEESGKKLMIYFRTDWCGYCDRMEETTFEDEAVIRLMEEQFVPVKVDAEAKRELAATFQVRSYPTIWFLTPEGEKILFLPGYAPAEPFLQVLRFIHTDTYREKSFEEYMEAYLKEKE